jgi:hypothetical protein
MVGGRGASLVVRERLKGEGELMRRVELVVVRDEGPPLRPRIVPCYESIVGSYERASRCGIYV